ncbi:MAG: DUF4832 domain-containing protein [Planctomycetes bacterium]|nr:DUF4832 domain-containing protein [Planctomycetota bacterium]
MLHLGVLILFLCICGSAAMCDDTLGFKTVTHQPEITDEILHNPGMGLFFMPGVSTHYEVDWFVSLVDIAYQRVGWYQLEPEEGVYKFDEVLDPVFDYWLKRGKRVALRVMSSSMHSREMYVTPKWVFDAGVPGVKLKGLYVPKQIDPAFWNPLYIEKQAPFIRALGKKYNGMEGLEFVDLGCVGEWGESHLMRWSTEDKEKTGYTPLAYTKAYMRFIDLYREAFPDTPLALNCGTSGAGHNDVIVDYAVSKGVWLRQDGLKEGYGREGASRYYHQYFRRVKTLYELCYGYRGMLDRGMTLDKVFKRGLEDPISYMNMNLAGTATLKKFPEVDRAAVRHAARYVGYRLAPVAVEHQDTIHIDKNIAPRLWMNITWRNLGAAPCYEYYAVEIALVDEKGTEVFRTVEMPDKPTTLWMPKEDTDTAFSLVLPQGLKPGVYALKIGLVDPFNEERHLLLPLKHKDEKGCYTIATVTAAPRDEPLPQPAIPGGDFEAQNAIEGWWFAKGLKASLVTDDAPQGKQCLRVEGETGKGWNYGGAPTIPLLPAAEYELSVKMKVLSIDDPKKPPYVKLGLTDAEGKWFTNVGTRRYDTSELGTWQELRGKFVTPATTRGGHFAIEKGGTLPRKVVLLLDDIRLHLLSAP